ncbi:MAG TPA: hypothetical protein VGC88_11045 [Terriglobales bacterium]
MGVTLASICLLLLVIVTTVQSQTSDLALVGAKIYLSPSEAPIESGTVLVHDRLIVSVGPIAAIKVPRRATVIDCGDWW